MKKIPALLITLFCLIEQPFAQTQKIIADKIVAQVGDKIILNSDIWMKGELEFDPKPSSDCYFLEAQLMQKCLAIQAVKDSITNYDELEAQLDGQIRNYIQQYGGQSALEMVAGKSAYQIKQDIRQLFIERKLADEMRNKITGDIKISPAEVKGFFEKIPKDSLPYYEAEYEINQLILYPKPNKDVEEYLTNQLLLWKQQVESGQKKFEDLAKVYDQDPGSRNAGGKYSINKNDRQWDPVWFAAIWKLKEGQISPVIKTKFGLHVIQMISRVGDEAVIRDILLIPSVTEVEINQSKIISDSIRTEVITNRMSFDDAINEFSEDESGRNNGGWITTVNGSPYLTPADLDKDMATILKTMKPGDISEPMLYKDDNQRDAVRLLFLRSKTTAHQENWKDDYDKIAQRALEQKKSHVLAQWFKGYIKDFSITVDTPFADCENVIQLLGK